MKAKNGGRSWKSLVVLGLPILVIIIIGSWLGSAAINSDASSSASVLLSVNGIEIPEEEFRMFLQDEKAATANYFYQTYAAKQDVHFWNTDYEGENPMQVARDNALKKLVQIKTEQQLAVQYGVIRSASYDYIKKQMNKEKSKYGVESMEEFQKYIVYHSKLVMNTKHSYKLKAVSVPDGELRQYYESNKEGRFKLPDRINTLVISLVQQKQDDEKISEGIPYLIDELRAGAKVEELKKKYFSQYGYVIEQKEYGKDEGKDENSSELEGELKELAYSLNTGQTSAPIEISGKTYVVICVERDEEQASTFDEAKQWIEDVMQDERFEQQVDNDSRNQNICVNEEWFNQIQMN